MQQDVGDNRFLLRSGSSGSDSDMEAQRGHLKLSRELERRKSIRNSVSRRPSISQVRERVSEKVQPEWTLLLVGCLLGLSTGLLVVMFNKGVSIPVF